MVAFGAFSWQTFENPFYSALHTGGTFIIHRPVDVVDTREHDDDFGIHAVQLPVPQPPQNILNLVRTPAKIRRVPAEEVRVPIGEVVLVLSIAGAPSAGDRVTLKINVDSALFCFFEQLLMRELRVCIPARSGNIGAIGGGDGRREFELGQRRFQPTSHQPSTR